MIVPAKAAWTGDVLTVTADGAEDQFVVQVSPGQDGYSPILISTLALDGGLSLLLYDRVKVLNIPDVIWSKLCQWVMVGPMPPHKDQATWKTLFTICEEVVSSAVATRNFREFPDPEAEANRQAAKRRMRQA